jgi:para-nitrobenzyl esterase
MKSSVVQTFRILSQYYDKESDFWKCLCDPAPTCSLFKRSHIGFLELRFSQMFVTIGPRSRKRNQSVTQTFMLSQEQKMIEDQLNRRSMIKAASGFAAAAILSAKTAVASPATNTPEKPPTKKAAPSTIVASDQKAIVEITTGKVRGYTSNGIYTFKGIPYGATTEGDGRFMPPTKPQPWSGLRSSMQYGWVAPQGPRSGWASDEGAWMFSWDDGVQSEDCLRVNVWTPAINDNKKRPVMVWLHGGGFVAGSGQELRAYDGENLCRRGDVVVVSLNHRLGILGYLDLSGYGPEYANSGNVGMLDIVLALEWVRDNIGNFGGDPGKVTIFGQSGGGGKVNTLLTMPSASGLVHRSITQSGSMLRVGTKENSAKVTAAVMTELGLSNSQVKELQKLPYQKLVEVGGTVLARLRSANTAPPGVGNMAASLGWGPIMDGQVVPRHPFDPDASPLSAKIPMMAGTVLNEFMTGLNHPEYEDMTNDEVKKRVSAVYGDKTDHILEVFRQAHPKDKPFDIMSLVFASSMRHGAVKQAELKAAQGAAPAYLYWFTWKTPVLDGRPRAFHCSDLSFCFDNSERCENMTGNGPEARELAAHMSDAWLSFARNGDPNHSGLPHWPAFSKEKCQTMIFNSPCRMKENPDLAERTVLGMV